MAADQIIPYDSAVGKEKSDNNQEAVPYEDAGTEREDTTSKAHPWSELPSNIGPSAGRFVGNLTYPLMHPKDFAEGIGKIATDRDTQKAVLQFYKDRYGSLDNLRNTVIADPVGAAADIAGIFSGGELTAAKAASTMGKLGMARTAAATGKVADVLGKASSYIDPVANTGRAFDLGKAGLGNAYTGVLGLTTLKGSGAFSDAARAGWEGSRTFLENLNKKVPVENIVGIMEDAVDRVKSKAHDYYRSNFPRLSTPIATHPIHDAWADLMGSGKLAETPASQESSAWATMTGGKQEHPDYQMTKRAANPVTDFTSESGLVKGDQAFADQMSGIKDLVDKYTTRAETVWVEDPKGAPILRSDGSSMQPGNWQTVNMPKARNIFDLDALKQALGDVQRGAVNPKIQMIAGRMYDTVKKVIEDAHPSYGPVMEKYAEAKSMLHDIRQTFSIGKDKAGVNTRLGKVGRIYNESPTAERSGELFDELEKESGYPLRAATAGQRLSNYLPVEGGPINKIAEFFAGKELGELFGWKAAAIAPFTSPKLMGRATYYANRVGGIAARNWERAHMPSPRVLGQMAVQAARPTELANDPEEIARIRAEQAAGID